MASCSVDFRSFAKQDYRISSSRRLRWVLIYRASVVGSGCKSRTRVVGRYSLQGNPTKLAGYPLPHGEKEVLELREKIRPCGELASCGGLWFLGWFLGFEDGTMECGSLGGVVSRRVFRPNRHSISLSFNLLLPAANRFSTRSSPLPYVTDRFQGRGVPVPFVP